MSKTEDKTPSDIWSLTSIFGPEKRTYKHVTDEFVPFHQHDGNVLAHLFTTSMGVWGAVQLACMNDLQSVAIAYGVIIGLTTPLMTAILHTAFLYAAMNIEVSDLNLPEFMCSCCEWKVCLGAIVFGYGLQDLAHVVFQEKTYMQSYMGQGKVVSRNRNVVTEVASRKSVEDLRQWIHDNVPVTRETTHVWPHVKEATSTATTALENDASILAGFRKVFAAKHFDVKPVQEMNEIYVTAVGAKKEINSDAVFYTPHTDGPYWFLPYASLYRVLVGVTPNTMVRTRFNLQHPTEDQVMDMYGVVGFDYNRELHWIDHVPGETNKERRSLLKLHFIVYPKGWHWYGKLCATLNTNYNTWARNNFLRTLRPKGLYEYGLAWWIWLTTWSNSMWEEVFGWSNLTYLILTFAMGPMPFLLLTSFRHYVVYMTTFAYRSPPVAHGYLMRDAKLFKTVALMHLGRRLFPLVDLPNDIPGVLLACCGFGTTLAATARLGMVRTYFGTELGFVKPCWISGFPYGYIPHPMIVGQLFAYTAILGWFWERLTTETVALIATHMSFYTAHMIQEIYFGSY